METVREFQLGKQDSWLAALTSLLPMWLVAFAVSFEGGLRLPIQLAYAALGLAFLLTFWLLWAGWISLDFLILYLTPFFWLYMLDEISIGYKTPFIYMAALVLAIGGLVAHRSNGPWPPALPLLVATVAAYFLLLNAVGNFWSLPNDNYAACFPYCVYPDHPWWTVFFHF